MKRNTLLSIALLAALVPTATARSEIFVIEAEDFDYANGQHLASASVMPYLGGAYASTPPAVAGVDYYRSFDVVDADQYRLGESPNVPLRSPSGTLNRGEWEVTVNHVIGWQDHAYASSWYNYTRDFPLGDYRVYAALSFGYTEIGALHGGLARVTSGVGTPLQTLDPLGTFLADGNGNWDRFQLIPLMQGDQPALVSLSGLETLRFDAFSGDIDHLLFVNQSSAIPEPASAAATAVGCLGFALILWRQKRRREGNPNPPG